MYPEVKPYELRIRRSFHYEPFFDPVFGITRFKLVHTDVLEERVYGDKWAPVEIVEDEKPPYPGSLEEFAGITKKEFDAIKEELINEEFIPK